MGIPKVFDVFLELENFHFFFFFILTIFRIPKFLNSNLSLEIIKNIKNMSS